MRGPLLHPASAGSAERSLLDTLVRLRARPGQALAVDAIIRDCACHHQLDEQQACAALSAFSQRGWLVLAPPGQCRLTYLGYAQLQL